MTTFLLYVSVLIVAATNDSFKIGAPISLPLLMLLFATIIVLAQAGVKVGWAALLGGGIIITYTTYGLLFNQINFVLQDLMPIVTIAALIHTRLGTRLVKNIIAFQRVLRLSILIIFAKVIFVVLFEPVASWDGNWLGTNYSFESGIPRIIFKGASPIIYLVLAIETTSQYGRGLSKWLTIFGALLLLILDGSRVVLLAGALVVAFGLFFAEKRKILRYLIMLFVLVSLLSVLNGSKDGELFRSTDQSVESIDFGGNEFAEVSVSWAYRLWESKDAIDSVTNVYFGHGLGYSFKTNQSGANSESGESPFAHSFPVWLYLKFGIFGLSFLLICLIMLLRDLFRSCAIRPMSLYVLMFLIASFFTNMAVTFSGALVLGVMLVLVRAPRKTPDHVRFW